LQIEIQNLPLPSRILTEPFLDRTAACNRGAQQARGQILYFSKAGYLQPVDLVSKIQHHFSDPQTMALAGSLRPLPSTKSLAQAAGLEMSFYQSAMETETPPCPSLACAAFRRREFLGVGGCQGLSAYAETDLDLCLRLAARPGVVVFNPTLYAQRHMPQTWPDWLAYQFQQGRIRFGDLLQRRRAGLKASPADANPNWQSLLVLLFLGLLFYALTQSPERGLSLAAICLLLFYPLNRRFLKSAAQSSPELMGLLFFLCLVRPFAWFGGMLSAAVARLTRGNW
jgi:cellulose synthase/poly-beta-1,6-N-acetylglucosamine synthase-like glycosyltransferase